MPVTTPQTTKVFPGKKSLTYRILFVVALVNFIAVYIVTSSAAFNYILAQETFTYKAENWLFILAILTAVSIAMFAKNHTLGKLLVSAGAVILILVSLLGLKDAQQIDQANKQHYKDISGYTNESLPELPPSNIFSQTPANDEVSKGVTQIYAGYSILAVANIVALVAVIANKKPNR